LSARVTNNVTTAAVANYDFGGSDEHTLNVPIKRSHHSDTRKHGWPVMFDHQSNASIAACHSAASCSAFGNFVM